MENKYKFSPYSNQNNEDSNDSLKAETDITIIKNDTLNIDDSTEEIMQSIDGYSSTNEQTNVHTNAFDVATYILYKLGRISTMKLQKLVYYSQAWSLVWDEQPLFQEEIRAWANGPVVSELFFQLKGLFQVVENNLLLGNFRKLNDTQIETIDAVLDHYGDKSAQWLIELAHSEDPWKNARIGLSESERSSRIIELDKIADYYSSL